MHKKQRANGIIWFRNNLRVTDNKSLKRAIEECQTVIAVYFFDPRQFAPTPWGFPKTGAHRLRFLLESLEALKQELQRLRIPLHFQIGTPENHLPVLAKKWKAEGLYTQKEWTSEEETINRSIRKMPNLHFKEDYDQFLIHPDDLPYKDIHGLPEVFTTFRKTVEKNWYVAPITLPEEKPAQENIPDDLCQSLPTLEKLGLTLPEPDSRSAFPFQGGTENALERIEHYFWKTKKLQYYKRTRNGLCGIDYSSKLSPWLANGSISAKMIFHEVKAFEKKVISNQDTYWLIFELLWRDYFKYLSLKHGNLLFKSGGIKKRKYTWNFDEAVFRKWTEGKTGNDFVDANMLELIQTGWMSNRGRQNVASYWAKDLEQDWRAGAAWFESLLIDYDVHSNWGNWNYVSGVGNDPRDRKFNTKLQAERYDPSGTFRKLWLQNPLF
ncbi:DASH family cryptochrome [Robertkochia flava]|uniref:DASH family cryptochrome n=1 Tax=Robertkochia flava TaxID=3447986 RepID=UPI001CCAF1D7|nr:DASH family cryptochrome [Robertkochia marina]